MGSRNGAAVLALAGLALAAGAGCGEESAGDESPAEALASVNEAGAQTFAEPTRSLQLRVASPGGSYEASGLIEPREGRFRVELSEISSPSGHRPRVVIGRGGEGFENTVEVTTTRFDGEPQRCWFNPHAPVGSGLGTASVEESARVTGAVLESLGEEVRSATHADANAYKVHLDPSATRPRNDFHQSKQRVWGDRNLLRLLDGPIQIALSEPGTVAQIALELRGYKPFSGFNPKARDPIPRVTIEAKLAPTDEDLVLDRPQCLAIE